MPLVGRMQANDRETFFPGRWWPTESTVTDWPINNIFPERCVDSPLDCAFVYQMCARTEWFLREFRRAKASLAAIFPTDHLLSGSLLFGTLSAHRPGHDIAKHAIRRHGLMPDQPTGSCVTDPELSLKPRAFRLSRWRDGRCGMVLLGALLAV